MEIVIKAILIKKIFIQGINHKERIVLVDLTLIATTIMTQNSNLYIILKATVTSVMEATKKGIKMFSGELILVQIVKANAKMKTLDPSPMIVLVQLERMMMESASLKLEERSLNNLDHNL